MGKLFDTIYDIEQNHALIRARAYGVIETREEKFASLKFRPWPKLGSIVEAVWAGGWGKSRLQSNRCLLYFSQPVFHRNFLTLNYVVTNWKTSMKTLVLGLSILDQIAQIKKSDALVCEVTNSRISNRVMRRYGWEEQGIHARRRHWIKRFYGNYPPTTAYAKLERTSSTR